MKEKNKKNYIEIINNIIKEMAFLESEPNIEDNLKDELGIDSIRLVELLFNIENEFNIEFDASDMDPAELISLKNIYDMVEKYV